MFKQSISINDGNYILSCIIKEKDSLINRLQERVRELENFILNIEIELEKEKPISNCYDRGYGSGNGSGSGDDE